MAFKPPASFYRDGFVQEPPPPRLLIATEGETETGKSEFGLSAPGPIIAVCVDRGIDGCVQNPDPPKWRREDYIVRMVRIPLNFTLDQNGFIAYWNSFRDEYYKALKNEDARSVMLDGDSDTWELQRLAEFGKVTQVMPLEYTSVNAKRRAFIAKAYDSGKNIIATNKVKPSYVDDVDPITGAVLLDNMGKNKRSKSKDGALDREGFPQTDYLWQVQLRHLRTKASTRVIEKGPRAGVVINVAADYGIKILKCKFRNELEGEELWGDKCNFRGLVELIFYHREGPRQCLCLNCANWGV